MALSTSIPAANAIPARLTTLRFLPKAFIKMKVPMMLIGIAEAATTVDEILLRNKISTVIARITPINIFLLRRFIAPLIYGRWSYAQSI